MRFASRLAKIRSLEEKITGLRDHEEDAVSCSDHADYQVRYLMVKKKFYSLQVQKKDSDLNRASGEQSSLLKYGKMNNPRGEENLEVNLKRVHGPTYRWR